MRLNNSTNVAPRANYKVQNLAQADFGAAKNLPVIITPSAPAQAGPNLLDVVAAAINPLAALGMQVGKWVLDQMAPKPAAAAPAPAPAPASTAMSAGERRRLEGAFRELDEDANGRLEGDELTSNRLVSFDPTSDAGMTASEFADEVRGQDGAASLSAEAVRAASVKDRIFELMKDVWGTDSYCNDTSYKWWKGQLKLVGGDFDRLRDKMAAYKKSIER